MKTTSEYRECDNPACHHERASHFAQRKGPGGGIIDLCVSCWNTYTVLVTLGIIERPELTCWSCHTHRTPTLDRFNDIMRETDNKDLVFICDECCKKINVDSYATGIGRVLPVQQYQYEKDHHPEAKI